MSYSGHRRPPSRGSTVGRAVRRLAALAALVVAAATLTACATDPDAADPRAITVWSMETQTDRMAATQKIVDAFTKKTGIKVKLVGTEEAQFPQLIVSAAAAGQLPDVIGALSLPDVRQMASNELLHPTLNRDIVRTLGEKTFSPRALQLTQDRGKQLAVPSDGWVQLLAYRKDLFAKAGLAPPTTYATIRAAAAKLNAGGRAGITMATVPDDPFTEQTFEDLALANGCELVDGGGTVRLDSPACVEAFRLYGDLTTKYSVPGGQDVDSTRATYFAGKAGMVVWSSYLLDELAGLRKDALPTCPECQADPTYLAKNTGIVTAMSGPSGRPSVFGEMTSWGITATAKSAASRAFVEYLMGDGYRQWLGIAPEGKLPARLGTPAAPNLFLDAWKAMPAGVDTKKPLAQIYPPDVIAGLTGGVATMRRWGITQGQGDLVGATLVELPVPKALNALAGGDLTPAAAAEQAAADVRSIRTAMQ